MSNRKVWRAALAATVPVLMGYSTMGAAFGILLVSVGFSPWWALLMSLTLLSGSLQFAAVGMLAQKMGLWETAMLSLFINIRYCLYGLSLIAPFRECGWKRFYMIFCLTDETYALEVADDRPPGVERNAYMFRMGLLDHLYWIFGCVAGALAGRFLWFDTTGIDFAMTALFLVILTDQIRVRSNRIPALIGFAATFAAMRVFGPETMLPPAMALMIAALLVLRRKLQ